MDREPRQCRIRQMQLGCWGGQEAGSLVFSQAQVLRRSHSGNATAKASVDSLHGLLHGASLWRNVRSQPRNTHRICTVSALAISPARKLLVPASSRGSRETGRCEAFLPTSLPCLSSRSTPFLTVINYQHQPSHNLASTDCTQYESRPPSQRTASSFA